MASMISSLQEFLEEFVTPTKATILHRKLVAITLIYDEYETLTGKKVDSLRAIIDNFLDNPCRETFTKITTDLIMGLKSPKRELDEKVVEMRTRVKKLLTEALNIAMEITKS